MRGIAAAPVLVAALALGACGASSLSDTQLRTTAARVCGTAQRRTQQISTPAHPADAARYLSRGIAALSPTVAELRALHPSRDLAGRYQSAVNTVGTEVSALRSAVRGLRSGDDPVVEIKTLEQRLAPLERRADDLWRSIEISACVSR
jgi:hypothetical protein